MYLTSIRASTEVYLDEYRDQNVSIVDEYTSLKVDIHFEEYRCQYVDVFVRLHKQKHISSYIVANTGPISRYIWTSTHGYCIYILAKTRANTEIYLDT